MSMTRAPFASNSATPLGPNITVSTTGPLASMVMTVSASLAAAAGEGATFAPAAASAWALAPSRFQTVTLRLPASRFLAMGAPIRPMPRKAIFGVFSRLVMAFSRAALGR